MNIFLDESAKNSKDTEEHVLSTEELLDDMMMDEPLQKRLSEQGKSGGIVLPLAEEMNSVLQEIEGFTFEYSGQQKIINWENSDVPYRVLRRAGSTEAGRLIKNQRRLGLAQYGRVPKSDGIQRGAKLIFSDPDYAPTKDEKLRLRVWEDKIFKNFFFPANDRWANLAKFIGNAYEDWFDLDDITAEIRRDGLGDPIAIHLQDPIIYKPVLKQTRIHPDWRLGDDFMTPYMENWEEMVTGKRAFLDEENVEPDYVLHYNNRRLGAATDYNVRKFHFFTRSDFRFAQRGYGIVEQSITILTYIINALKMNASNFMNNKLPKGFVLFTGGGIGALQLEKLKKVMSAYMGGTAPNRFPIMGLNSEKGDGKWVGIGGNSREMEYHLWITLLFSIFCRLSGTDPREVSLGAHSDAIRPQSIGEKSADGVVNENRDMGERTFLTHLKDSLNVTDKYGLNLFQQLTQMKVELDFAGFEIEDKKLKQEITKLNLQTSKSLNEVLSNEDKEKYTLMIDEETNLFDIPAVNSEVVRAVVQFKLQAFANKQAAEQQQAGGGMPGQPGAEPGSEGEQAGGEGELTDDDKALIEKYKGASNVEIDKELQQ
jgi:hypothetical protein